MQSGFPAIRETLPMNVRATGRRLELDDSNRKEIERIDTLWQGFRRNHLAEGPFLCGRFGIIDAMFLPVVFRFRSYGVELGGSAQAYASHMLSLEATREWLHASEEEKEVIYHAEVGEHSG